MEHYLVFLKDQISSSFSRSELSDLCLELNVDWDEVEADSKSKIITNILKYLHRRSKLDPLVSICKNKRPLLSWDSPTSTYLAPGPSPDLLPIIELHKPLFYDLIEEVEKHPVGRAPIGSLLIGMKRVTNGEVTKEEFAIKIMSLLNKGDINYSVAKRFLTRIGYDVNVDDQDFVLIVNTERN